MYFDPEPRMSIPEAADDAAPKVGLTGGVPRVLIVEDEVLVGWSLANAFRKIGMEVLIVESGEKAIEHLAATRFDLVITDFKLPHIDGFDVAAAVKSSSPGTPVIMMSALEVPTSGGKAAGSIDSFVEKPFDLKEMTAIAGSLLSSRQHR